MSPRSAETGRVDEIGRLLARQSGVITRRQAQAAGLRPHDIRRLIRHRIWAPLHNGAYVDHTGEPTWLQRAWGAVLVTWPAALSHESAIRAMDGPGRRGGDGIVHVAVDRGRRVAAPDGVRVHYVSGLEAKTLWNLGPPRLRLEEAVLDLAAEAPDDLTVVGLLADAVQRRRTTPARIRAALAGRSRIARRGFLEAVLGDVAEGTCSVLEHAYLTRVERPHGLPTASRQHVVRSPRRLYRDGHYQRFGLEVELDGRIWHERSTARDHDLERDLDVLLEGGDTARLGWGQVLGRPCGTALKVAALLQQRGWDGHPTACPSCPGQQRRTSEPPGDSEVRRYA